jgi:hypothetical protein
VGWVILLLRYHYCLNKKLGEVQNAEEEIFYLLIYSSIHLFILLIDVGLYLNSICCWFFSVHPSLDSIFLYETYLFPWTKRVPFIKYLLVNIFFPDYCQISNYFFFLLFFFFFFFLDKMCQRQDKRVYITGWTS